MRGVYRPLGVLFSAILVMVLVSGLSKWLGPKDLVRWRTNLATARAEAEVVGKPLLIYLTASWCGPCERMKVTTFADDDVNATIRSFIPVKIDIDQYPELAREYAAPPVPRFLVVDTSGEVRRTLEGACDPKEFVSWLNSSSVDAPRQVDISRQVETSHQFVLFH